MSKERLFVVIVSIAILGLSTWAQEADKRREALEELKALLASAPTPTTTGPLRPFTKYDLEILNSDSCQVKYVNDIFLLAEIDPASIKAESFVADAVVGKPTVYQTVFHTTNYRPSLTNDVQMPQSRSFIGRVPTQELSEQIAASFKAAVLVCGGKPSDDSLPDTVVDVDLKAESKTAGAADFAVKNVHLQSPYRFCKEITHDVQLEGLAKFERKTITSNGKPDWVEFSVETDPDTVLLNISRATVHIKLLEVVDPVASKCPAYEAAFSDESQDGPSYGWVRMHGYAENPHSDFLDVHAVDPANETYCDHKVVITNQGGDRNYFSLQAWTKTTMRVFYGANSGVGLDNAGSNIGLTLYARFVDSKRLAKHPEWFACTGTSPEKFQAASISKLKLSENIFRFVVVK